MDGGTERKVNCWGISHHGKPHSLSPIASENDEEEGHDRCEVRVLRSALPLQPRETRMPDGGERLISLECKVKN